MMANTVNIINNPRPLFTILVCYTSENIHSQAIQIIQAVAFLNKIEYSTPAKTKREKKTREKEGRVEVWRHLAVCERSAPLCGGTQRG